MNTETKRKRAVGSQITVAKALVRPEYAKYVASDDSLDYIEQLKEARRKERAREAYIPPNKIVGTFGIIDSKGHEVLMAWSINGLRTDKRHGVVDKPVPLSRHSKVCLDSMFKGW